MTVAVCLKWADLRPRIDPLTAEVSTDDRTSGASDADLAALAWALRLGDLWGEPVLAVTAGAPNADAALREAASVGARRVVRVDIDPDAPSELVAAGLAAVVADSFVVVCGDRSADRGSGGVPALLAAHRGAAQALGLVELALPEGPGPLRAVRRLDGGRQEHLEVPLPAVLSVEAGTARPPRAALPALMAARHTGVEVVAGPEWTRTGPVVVSPYRPRPRHLEPPGGADARQRVLQLAGTAPATPWRRVLHAPPAEAADAIVEQLRAWGVV